MQPEKIGATRHPQTRTELQAWIRDRLRLKADEEAELLRGENLGAVFMGEHELATAITRHVIGRLEPDAHAH